MTEAYDRDPLNADVYMEASPPQPADIKIHSAGPELYEVPAKLLKSLTPALKKIRQALREELVSKAQHQGNPYMYVYVLSKDWCVVLCL